MEGKEKLSKDEIEKLIESELYKLVETSIESEYDTDRLNNLVYKTGGRRRTESKIKELLKQWEEKYDFPKSEIINCLINAFNNIGLANNDEGREITEILNEINTEEQVKKDIEEGNIEKYERNI